LLAHELRGRERCKKWHKVQSAMLSFVFDVNASESRNGD